jgi:hypothetical protein
MTYFREEYEADLFPDTALSVPRQSELAPKWL